MLQVVKGILCDAIIFVVSISSASPALAKQQKVNASASASQSSQQSPSQNQIRVHVNEVVAPVTVTDKSGNLVLDLSQSDFQVFDSGVKQVIDHWELGGDPLAVALVIETSSRIRMMADTIHRMGPVFTETLMALNGEAAVITCDSTVEVVEPFTRDHDAIQKAIGNTNFEVYEMKLHDGMAKAIELLKAQPRDFRRILLVIGESQDTASQTKLGQVLRDAELADIAIYAIGPSSTSADLRYSRDGLNDMKVSQSLPSISVTPPGATPATGRITII